MYKLLKIGTQANIQIREYVVDTISDIASLPSSDPFGSTALVIATGEKYIKNSSGNYVAVQSSSGGNSGSSGSNSGDGVFIVQGVLDYDDQEQADLVTIDKTTTEIYEAADGGTPVIMLLDDDGDISEWILSSTDEGKDEDIFADFMTIAEDKDGVIAKTVTFHSDSDGREITTYPLGQSDDEPVVITATLSVNGESKQTITLNKTAEEVWQIAESGQRYKIVMDIPIDNDKTIHMTMIFPVEIFKSELDDMTAYTIKVRPDTTQNDRVFCCANTYGANTVVLTEQ